MRGKTFIFMALTLFLLASVSYAGEYGVYVKVIERAKGSFDEVSSNVEAALKTAGWEVLGAYNTGVPEGCKFRSRVIVFSSPAYAKSIMATGVKAAFSLPLRAGIYEDESGINVAVVNPASLNRTIIHETKLNDLSLSTINSVVDAIAKAVAGNIVKKQIGEIRSKGKVGGMGGGDFLDKIVEIYVSQDSADAAFKSISENVKKGILGNKKNWKLIYTYDLSAYNAMIFGLTEAKMEGRAFRIAGEKRASDSYKFPGIDHNTAFPIEVIVYKDADRVRVVTLDGMYRMKVYFEDAGKWAFMKNMAMPGQIEDEIVEMVRTNK
ncbi:MAG: hypothetical protein DDT18_01961 [Actinobacteria bacterium]|nr:hypothetical protein [Actinomycetota bacterium]